MQTARQTISSRAVTATGEITPCSAATPDRTVAIHFALGHSSLGHVLVARTGKGVCAILLGDEPKSLARDLHGRFPGAALREGGSDVERLLTRISNFIEAPAKGLDLALDPYGTEFQRRVWEALRRIPAGETVSYTDLARRIGAPKSARAVAQACGANSIAVAIPCHRVVRNDGNLSGYRWGVERKRSLLEREGVRV